MEEMSDQTKSLNILESGNAGKSGKNVKGHKNGRSNGKGKGRKNGVPKAQARVGSQTVVEAEPQAQDHDELAAEPGATQRIETIEAPNGANGSGHSHSNGNGYSNRAAARVAGVRPVKVRLHDGNGLSGHESPVTPYLGEGHFEGEGDEGNVDLVEDAHGDLESEHVNGNGHNGHKARVVAPPTVPAVTARLRDTDITELRLRLKREEWTLTPPQRRGGHKRPLPYFMMRHRNMRSRSRVGHTRAQAAQRRHGNGAGIGKIILALTLVVTIFTTMVGAAGAGGAAMGAAWYIENRLPPVVGPGALNGLQMQTTRIYDRNGVELSEVVDLETGRRQYKSLDEISPLVISATIAVEDATFYTNSGIDIPSIFRAVYINLGGKGSSGASTITQQLVRQVNLPEDERTEVSWNRKIREAIQAVLFTEAYDKDYILEMYLNENYYGNRAYGIEAAALTYFGKSSKDLDLKEAALLAGLPQAPSDYDPFVDWQLARKRQAIVLDLMAKQGMITEADAAKAKGDTIVLRTYKPPLNAPHFVNYVTAYLQSLYGPDVMAAGLVVTTTLDLKVQLAAEKVARDRIEELRRQKATNCSIVIMNPQTGEILAMVGSVDYNDPSIDGQVNVATRERQPGSSFKPITYAAAFEKGWTPGTVLLDSLTAFPNPGQKPYAPKNYDGRDHGWVSVREALGNSYNVPAVKALQYAGIQETIDTAHDMGIQGLNRGLDWYGLSLTLGGGEVTLLDMTTAYSTFANGGTAVPANPILAIQQPGVGIINCNEAYLTADGTCSRQLQKQFGTVRTQALDPRISYMVTDILSDNRARTSAFGPNSPLRLPFTAAAKTGTTDDNRDSWTLGYTPELTVGVWVGNSNNDEMLKVTGAIGAAVVWRNMMTTFYNNPEFVGLVRNSDGSLQEKFVQPEGLIKKSACSNKGTINDFFLAEAPPKGCTTYKDKNTRLGSIPGSSKPKAKPTPLPGIWPPLEP